MAIKRLTIELDDSVENYGPTTIPASLSEDSPQSLKQITSTDVTEYDSSMETNEGSSAPLGYVTTGRTFPDLIVEFMNNSRAMATILFFVPFIIFVAKIDSVDSLKYPLITGLILNVVWFGIPAGKRLIEMVLRGGKKKNTT